jgi:hypothetical protein
MSINVTDYATQGRASDFYRNVGIYHSSTPVSRTDLRIVQFPNQ